MAPSVYPVDPMTLFYAAVSSVENGKVHAIELEFRNDTDDVIMTINIQRDPRPVTMFVPSNPIAPKEE